MRMCYCNCTITCLSTTVAVSAQIACYVGPKCSGPSVEAENPEQCCLGQGITFTTESLTCEECVGRLIWHGNSASCKVYYIMWKRLLLGSSGKLPGEDGLGYPNSHPDMGSTGMRLQKYR